MNFFKMTSDDVVYVTLPLYHVSALYFGLSNVLNKGKLTDHIKEEISEAELHFVPIVRLSDPTKEFAIHNNNNDCAQLANAKSEKTKILL